MQNVKGFKATNSNIECRDYQFGIGNFHHDGKVIPCESGFHFCEKLEDVFSYYHPYNPECRVFEVIGSGTVKYHYDKIVCSDIEFVREINYADYIDHDDSAVRCLVASHIDDERLSLDLSNSVRKILVDRGLHLDKFINDKDYGVRVALARQKYRLDILINDWHYSVRREVARQGYGHDILINDIDDFVRNTVTALLTNEEVRKHYAKKYNW